nr:hypothetical protein [Prevotella sp.]
VTTGGLTITSMAEGYQSDVWLGTNKGIHRLNRSNLSVEQSGLLLDQHITALHSNGYNIFGATDKGAIYSFAYGQEPRLIRQPQGEGMAIYSLFVDSRNLIWFCDDRMGCSRLNQETGNEKLFQQNVPVPEYDGRGGKFTEYNSTVWAVMNHGGYGYYNRETDEVEYFHNDPINPWNLSNTVYATCELPEGVIWESTSRRGLDKLEMLKNTIVRKKLVENPVSPAENEIRAMYYDEKRKLLLLGNKHNTLYLFRSDGSHTTITADDSGHPLGRLYGITKDKKGNYLLCSKDFGLFKMTPQGNGGWSLKNYRHDANNKYSLSSNGAYKAVEDKEGNIWIATYGGGVNLLTKNASGQEIVLHRGNDMRRYPRDSYQKVRAISLDKYGNVWAGTTDGILILSYKNRHLSIEKLQNPSEDEHILMSNDIVCLECDKQGQMWVGTNGGGLSHTIGQEGDNCWLFENFGAHDGLPSEELRSITFDQHNNVWFAADRIICSYNTEKKVFTTFSNLDGVDETMLSEGAAISTDKDEILFGTIDGYYVVDRQRLMNGNGSLLKLRITDFFINDEIQSPRLNSNFDYYPPESRSIKLPARGMQFAFRFAAMNYQLQHRVHYQYMLEGYDDEWKNADVSRIARYSNVPGGTYKFKVKAFLLESPDKYDMRTIEIIVPSSALLSPLALAIYLLLSLIALFLVFKHRGELAGKWRNYRASRKKAQETSKQQEEKTDEYEVIDGSIEEENAEIIVASHEETADNKEKNSAET